ncbi:uncharacterized protein LOC122256374 [Penaeus japonicus]|uniref:uncharacterized protein LOC122256374 n=1 Tax=Penaeus japonicus TaxID=27405 RepID=UPI001C713D47|nr:uncharacterized protein LOC122256374 [Penaeus japonicus]
MKIAVSTPVACNTNRAFPANLKPHIALHYSKSDSEVVSQQRSAQDGEALKVDSGRPPQGQNQVGDPKGDNRRSSYGGGGGRDFHGNYDHARRNSRNLHDLAAENRIGSGGGTGQRQDFVSDSRLSSGGSYGRSEFVAETRRGSGGSNGKAESGNRRGSRGSVVRPEFVVDSRKSSGGSNGNRSRSRCSEGEADSTARGWSNVLGGTEKGSASVSSRRGSQAGVGRDCQGVIRKEGTAAGNTRGSQGLRSKEASAAESRRISQEEKMQSERKGSGNAPPNKDSGAARGGAEGQGVPPPVSRHLSDSSIDLSQRNYRYSDENITRVLDMLYLGNIKAAYCEPILCRLSIEGIVDFSSLRPFAVPAEKKSICPCTCPLQIAHHRSRLCINIGITEGLDITSYMSEVNRFIESFRRRKMNVLVHCYHGTNRAPAFIIQYLMCVHHLPLATSYALVKAASKTKVDLHRTFRVALQNLEKELWPCRPPSMLFEESDAIKSPLSAVSKPAIPPTRSAWQ